MKLAGCSGRQNPLDDSGGKAVLAEDIWLNGEESTLYWVGESGGVVGLLLSLIGPNGKERWRYASPHSDDQERVVVARQLGDVAVLQTYTDSTELVALDLATGKVLWRR